MRVDLDTSDFILRRGRFLTLIVLTAVMGGITLANLSSEPLTPAHLEETLFKGRPAERSFGWPVRWYWRAKSSLSGSGWSVSRSSLSALAANIPIWLAVLGVGWAACVIILRRVRARPCWQPRAATVIALVILAVLTVLANLSCDSSLGPQSREFSGSWFFPGSWEFFDYGWPLIWCRRMELESFGSSCREWDFNAAALAGNVATWLLLLVVTAVACGWLMRRRRRRLQWSIRTMLLGVAAAAAFCAWWVRVCKIAAEQDDIVERVNFDDHVYFERSGPKWLDVVGADWMRRRMAAVRVEVYYPEAGEELFARLARLQSLQFLDIEPQIYRQPFVFTPRMAAALAAMRQLRMLNVDCQGWERDESPIATHRCIVALGELTQLERLRLSIWQDDSGELANLSNLTNLKTLSLGIDAFEFRDDVDLLERRANGISHVLDRLPALPRLEQLDLHGTLAGDADLGRLASFERLRSLDLSLSSVSAAGLGKLPALESLEELAIDDYQATAAAFEALLGLKRLRKVHIALHRRDDERLAWLTLDDGQKLLVSREELNRTALALRALRNSNPGISIDGDYDAFANSVDLEPPWDDSRGTEAFVQRWLYER